MSASVQRCVSLHVCLQWGHHGSFQAPFCCHSCVLAMRVQFLGHFLFAVYLEKYKSDLSPQLPHCGAQRTKYRYYTTVQKEGERNVHATHVNHMLVAVKLYDKEQYDSVQDTDQRDLYYGKRGVNLSCNIYIYLFMLHIHIHEYS